MTTRIKTGGRKDFVYDENQKLEHTDSSKAFVDAVKDWQSKPKIIRFWMRHKIPIITSLIFLILGIYYAFSRYLHYLHYPELLQIPLIPLAIMCGTGFLGDTGLGFPGFICYNDIMIPLTFAVQGFILGIIIKWLIIKFKKK